MAVMEAKIAVQTTGSAGSATGEALSELPLAGILLGFRVKYHSAPATTDVIITADLPAGYPTLTLLTLTNINTDIGYRPVETETYDATNTGTGIYTLIPVQGHKIKVAVAQADALNPCVTVWAVYLKD